MTYLVLFVIFLGQSSPAPTTGARDVEFSAPRSVVVVDTGKLKGEPSMLAWSPDGSELYLQLAERDRGGVMAAAKHFVVSVAVPTLKSADQQPPWASKYWAWKSGQASPAAAAFKIAVEQQQRTVRATSAPTGGALARGGTADPTSGTTTEDAVSAANQSQTQNVYLLRVNGEALGEWINEPVIPGITFGWAPAPQRLIAYVKKDGGPLLVLDDQNRKREVPGAKAALLPAWSEDGLQLAWLERKDKKHYDLTIASATPR